MNIGQAAEASGVSAKMIRHYESLGLLPDIRRTEAGYRQYDGNAVHTLRFIRRARDLGFSVKEIAELLALWADRGRASGDVKRIATAHIADLEEKMRQIREMVSTLKHLADHCHGDDRPHCPILENLARGDVAEEPRKRAAEHSARV